MNFYRVIVGEAKVNCYFLWDSKKNCIVIDPGGDSEVLIKFLKEKKLKLKAILLTHYHYDHIMAVEPLNKEFDAPIYIHKDGIEGLNNSKLNLSFYKDVNETRIKAHKGLDDKEVLTIGSLKLEIIYTPGHTLGSICIKYEDVIFTGDTLFKGYIGRSDFEEGCYETLIDSIVNRIFTYKDETIIYPGHFESSSIGEEKRCNPKVIMSYKSN